MIKVSKYPKGGQKEDGDTLLYLLQSKIRLPPHSTWGERALGLRLSTVVGEEEEWL